MKKDRQATYSSFITYGHTKRKRHCMTVTIILTIIVIVFMISLLMLGNTYYSFRTIISVLSGEEIKGAAFAIQTIRFPRMLAGVLSGFAFGMAGNAFQTMLANPLASPDVIGVVSGSSAAAIFSVLFLNLSGTMVSLISILFGMMAAAIIYILSKKGGFSGARLILAGIGIQAILQAVISYFLLKASQYDTAGTMRWLSGTLSGLQMRDLKGLLWAVCVGAFLLTILGRHLKILELGEHQAITLGLKPELTRIFIIISAVCLTAFATAATGPIAFVAFLSGPIMKRIVGYGNSSTVCAGLVGAILVLGADLIGQHALQVRLPVGVITGILGAPYLIFSLIKINKKEKLV